MFTWDEDKRALNRVKHGVDFDLMVDFDWQHALHLADKRQNYGEDRFRAFGLLNGRLHVAVYTVRGETIRIISLRRANEREENLYATHKNHH